MTFLRKSARFTATAAAAAMLLAAPLAQAAPRAWMLPSDTMFSGGGDDWMTVDAAISTDLYFYDHPAQPWKPVAWAPDGASFPVENQAAGKLRSTFDVHLTRPGTYKVSVVANQVMGSYMLEGERKVLPRGTTAETMAAAVPPGATEVWSAPANLRIETFATAGEPTSGVFKATGQGIEMTPVTHPNDLAVGEPATFQFLLDGKPAAKLPVQAIPGGVRYRSDLKLIEAVTDAQGKVTLTWPEPGMYWVSVTSGAMRGPEGGGPSGPGGPGGQSRPQGAGGPSPSGAGAAAGSGGERRVIRPPTRRDTYVMTLEVVG